MKISSFLIGIVLVGMFVVVMNLFYADIAQEYSVTYNNTTFAGYQQLESINEDMAQINQSLTGLQQSNSVFDILGGFLGSGYNVVKITFNSFGAFYEMADAATTNMAMAFGVSATVFKTYLVTIIFILFAFAVVSILVGRDI